MSVRAHRRLHVTKPHFMHGPDVEELQRALNKRVKQPGGFDPIKVDGEYGHDTNILFLHVGWDLGFSDKSLRKGATVFAQRKVKGTMPRTPADRLRTRKRHGHKNPFLHPKPKKPPVVNGLMWIDGRQVASWIGEIVLKVREAGHWKGVVTSGYRDPVYSQHLCYAMCGAPSCPGRCAGLSSNHVGKEYPAGAVDVTDYVTFGSELRRLGLTQIHNGLAATDPVHFSHAGN